MARYGRVDGTGRKGRGRASVLLLLHRIALHCIVCCGYCAKCKYCIVLYELNYLHIYNDTRGPSSPAKPRPALPCSSLVWSGLAYSALLINSVFEHLYCPSTSRLLLFLPPCPLRIDGPAQQRTKLVCAGAIAAANAQRANDECRPFNLRNTA